jgi:Sulfotransferase family
VNFVSQIDTFHERACAATGLGNFGPEDYREPMQRLLADYDANARFTAIGRQMSEGQITAALISRLIAQDNFARYPEFLADPIEKPIVIVTMMRSGSTALLRLLAQDPANQALPPWLASAPMPRPPRAGWETNPWYRQSVAAFEQLYRIAPDIRRMHPMQADEPDECRLAIDQTFWSPGMATMATAPEYARWCLECDAAFAYRRYRRILGLIAGGSSQRWVLKDPCHSWGLDTLLKEFPDACIVWMHRDPVAAMIGAATIMYEARRSTGTQSREAVGREQLDRWGRAAAKAEKVRRAGDSSRFFDLHMRELQRDPAGSAERIYHHFGLPVTDAARNAWSRYLASKPDAGHSPFRYTAEDFGFTAADVHAVVGDYSARYQSLNP